eukprot:8531909-Alexandrium_andersonii.AAC.1
MVVLVDGVVLGGFPEGGDAREAPAAEAVDEDVARGRPQASEELARREDVLALHLRTIVDDHGQ